jgi:Replication-relaxation
MTGNNRRGMVLQERDLRLLRELATLRVADRELVKAVAGFGSTTRVNARLLALVRAGLLRRFSFGHTGATQKFLYALSEKGAQYAGVPFRGPRRRNNKPLIADVFIEHQLAINAVYRALRCEPIPLPGLSFARWLTFFEPIAPGSRLIPDGYFELESPRGERLAAFVEVDLSSEHLPIWRQKVESYVQVAVSDEFERRFGQTRFRVLVVVNSERRLQSLRKTTAGVTDSVFWFATLESVNHDGLFGPVWLRPTGTGRLPLIGSLP